MVFNAFSGDANEGFSLDEVEAQLNACLPSAEEELSKCKHIVQAGARDGVSGRLDMFVDGMPIEDSVNILKRLRLALSESS